MHDEDHEDRHESAPITERFNLDSLILGLANDLRDLRAGRISVPDARARAELARQIMRGVGYALQARKVLEKGLDQLQAPEEPADGK
jgi:hypothetical protein